MVAGGSPSEAAVAAEAAKEAMNATSSAGAAALAGRAACAAASDGSSMRASLAAGMMAARSMQRGCSEGCAMAAGVAAMKAIDGGASDDDAVKAGDAAADAADGAGAMAREAAIAAGAPPAAVSAARDAAVQSMGIGRSASAAAVAGEAACTAATSGRSLHAARVAGAVASEASDVGCKPSHVALLAAGAAAAEAIDDGRSADASRAAGLAAAAAVEGGGSEADVRRAASAAAQTATVAGEAASQAAAGSDASAVHAARRAAEQKIASGGDSDDAIIAGASAARFCSVQSAECAARYAACALQTLTSAGDASSVHPDAAAAARAAASLGPENAAAAGAAALAACASGASKQAAKAAGAAASQAYARSGRDAKAVAADAGNAAAVAYDACSAGDPTQAAAVAGATAATHAKAREGRMRAAQNERAAPQMLSTAPRRVSVAPSSHGRKPPTSRPSAPATSAMKPSELTVANRTRRTDKHNQIAKLLEDAPSLSPVAIQVREQERKRLYERQKGRAIAHRRAVERKQKDVRKAALDTGRTRRSNITSCPEQRACTQASEDMLSSGAATSTQPYNAVTTSGDRKNTNTAKAKQSDTFPADAYEEGSPTNASSTVELHTRLKLQEQATRKAQRELVKKQEELSNFSNQALTSIVKKDAKIRELQTAIVTLQQALGQPSLVLKNSPMPHAATMSTSHRTGSRMEDVDSVQAMAEEDEVLIEDLHDDEQTVRDGRQGQAEAGDGNMKSNAGCVQGSPLPPPAQRREEKQQMHKSAPLMGMGIDSAHAVPEGTFHGQRPPQSTNLKKMPQSWACGGASQEAHADADVVIEAAEQPAFKRSDWPGAERTGPERVGGRCRLAAPESNAASPLGLCGNHPTTSVTDADAKEVPGPPSNYRCDRTPSASALGRRPQQPIAQSKVCGDKPGRPTSATYSDGSAMSGRRQLTAAAAPSPRGRLLNRLGLPIPRKPTAPPRADSTHLPRQSLRPGRQLHTERGHLGAGRNTTEARVKVNAGCGGLQAPRSVLKSDVSPGLLQQSTQEPEVQQDDDHDHATEPAAVAAPAATFTLVKQLAITQPRCQPPRSAARVLPMRQGGSAVSTQGTMNGSQQHPRRAAHIAEAW